MIEKKEKKQWVVVTKLTLEEFCFSSILYNGGGDSQSHNSHIYEKDTRF